MDQLFNLEGLLGQLSIAALFMVIVWQMNRAHARTTDRLIDQQKDTGRWHAEARASSDRAFIEALHIRDNALTNITDQLGKHAEAVRAVADAANAITNRLQAVEMRQTQSETLSNKMLLSIDRTGTATENSVKALQEMTAQLGPVIIAQRDTTANVAALTSTIREALTEMIKVRQELTELAKRLNGYAQKSDIAEVQAGIDTLTRMLTDALHDEPTTPTIH